MKFKSLVSRLLWLFGSLLPLCTIQAEQILLSDFGDHQAAGFTLTVPVETADFMKNGTRLGKITGKGFQTIAKYKFTRQQASELMQKTPLLKISLAASRAESTGNFLLILPMIQTDVTGEELYEPSPSSAIKPWEKPYGNFALDLRKFKSKSISSLPDIFQRFANGEGNYLTLGIIQQTRKEDTSVVYYERILLASD